MPNLSDETSLFEILFSSSTEANLIVDAATGDLLDANSAAEHLFGRSRAQLLKMNKADLLASNSSAEKIVHSTSKKVREKARSDSAPVEVLHTDGSVISAHLDSQAHEQEGQKILLETYRPLKGNQDNSLFRTISEAAQDAIIILDEDGVITYWNNAATRIFGYSHEYAIGQAAHDLITPEQSRHKASKGWNKFRETGNGPVVNSTLELSALCQDGSELPIELSVSSLKVNDNWIAIGFARDISRRVAAEKELIHKEKSLAEAQRLTKLGSWELDIVNNSLSWSDENYRIFEIDQEQFNATYEAFLNVIHPDDREMVNRAYTESIENQTAYNITHRLQMKDGRIKYVHEICETSYSDKGEPLISLGTVQDITEQYLASQRLELKNRALHTLSLGNKVLTREEDESSLLQAMCKVITEDAGYRFAWIGYAEHDENKTLRLVASAGYEKNYLKNSNLTWADNAPNNCPACTAVRTAKPVLIKDIHTDPSFLPWREAATQRGYASVLALPLINAGNAFAVLSIFAHEPNVFEDQEIELLAELAEELAYGITSLRLEEERNRLESDQHELVEKHKQALISTIRAISLTVEKRDPYTAGHQQRVAELAVQIGESLELSDQRIEGLRLGALIHDIGKISVPAEILSKPGQLSNAEFEIIKAHTEVGYDIVKDINFPWPVSDMILQHHERIDGSGYPNGLEGKDIILESKILAVADVVEAINSHRPYRPALGMDAALECLEEGKGELFDSAVVDACLFLVRKQGFTFDLSSN